MTTKTVNLERYKEAIKAKFEEEKNGIYSSFLISPSRAKLRQLCEEKLKISSNPDDLNSFKFLFGFDFDASNKNKLQANTDKFRPIETFLKGETDLSDLNAINLAAMLVDFNPRPFGLYAYREEFKNNSSQGLIETNASKNSEKEVTSLVIVNEKTYKQTSDLKKKIAIGFMGLIGITSIGYTTKNMFFKDKECMQWQKNHYEYVDCDKKELIQLYPIVAVDVSLINLQKIEVNNQTTFFRNGKPIVWYCKNNNKLEFYNSYGVHPETGKPLKPITNYMIKKYVK